MLLSDVLRTSLGRATRMPGLVRPITELQAGASDFIVDELSLERLAAEVRFLRGERARLVAEIEHRRASFRQIFDACPTAISIHSFPATISTAPVGIVAFTVASVRSATRPCTATTYSDPNSSAFW